VMLAPRVMAGTYRHILRRLVERRWAPPRRQIQVGLGTHAVGRAAPRLFRRD
jgi:hypothetical protein